MLPALVPEDGRALESHTMGFHIYGEDVIGRGGFGQVDRLQDRVVDVLLKGPLNPEMIEWRHLVRPPEHSFQFPAGIR